MGAKVYADLLSDDEPLSLPTDPELEAEIVQISAWFEALSTDWKAYFDREAVSGRLAYGQA